MRPNKNAAGQLYTEVRREKVTGKIRITNPKHPLYNDEKTRKCLQLVCYGNLDSYNRRKGLGCLSVKVKKEHPTDKGYFKEVFILSRAGRIILNSKK